MKLAFVGLLFVCVVLFPSYWAFVPGFRAGVEMAAHFAEMLAGVIAIILVVGHLLRRSK